MKFISGVSFPSWPGNSVKPNFPQYESDRRNKKFNYTLEIKNGCKNLCLNSKLFQITLKSNSYPMPISRRGPVNFVNPLFPKNQFYKNKCQ